MNQPNRGPHPPDSPRSAVRLRGKQVGFAILAGLMLGGVIVTLDGLRRVDSRSIFLGLEGVWGPLFMVLALLAIVSIGTIWLRPKKKYLVMSALFLSGVLAVGATLFRIDSFYGSMMPRFAWRWSPTPEATFENYQASQPASGEPERVVIAVEETPWDYPGFLGSQRNGVVQGLRIDPDWSGRVPEEQWRHPVGLGWSGFAIVGDLAITQEQRGEQEAVVAYHRKTGVECWSHEDQARFRDAHGDGPRATPTIFGGRVFTMGATGILNCLDVGSGALIWRQETLPESTSTNLLWGMAGSPLVLGEWVIVSPGGGPGRSLIAYRIDDGSEVWAAGDDPAGYASPMLAEFSGKKQIISFNGAGLRGYSLDGEPLWFYPWLTQGELQRVNVAQPVVVPSTIAGVEHDQVLISSGYSMGMSLLEVSCRGQEWKVEERWHSNALKSKLSNFVLFDGHIYGLDNGILTCLELATGRLVWKQGRLGHGQILLVDATLLIQAESGEIVLVAARPDGYKEHARLAALTAKTWNHAALSGGYLLVRNDREAACYRLPLLP